ncbi:hypothetical protein [Actinocatenispora thailandica]|uniref:hypothetical protein n=1 Tax=Actinocatenispora thailandica TaxID=227318 RepID=UPI0031D877EC
MWERELAAAEPRRPGGSPVALWVCAGLAWLVLACVGTVRVSTVPFVFLDLPMQLAGWLLAGGLTVALLRRIRGRRWVLPVTVAVLVAACFHSVSWSVFEPRSYYAAHRYAFAMVAADVRDGSIGASTEYYGDFLPWYLHGLSATGRAAVVGQQHGRPVVFLPQWLGMPDDAGGYVYVQARPAPDLLVDLFGEPLAVDDGLDLGDGWWYLPAPAGGQRGA